ncbi:alpha/beta fold hydrolase [Alkalinema sp. FACHB-956]|uniref:alpha/beta fold hydrolase n=1 Tax=Alkalinema sp. FACHB-956 TaxID=2692768 RepID=UPI0016898BBD|nr:alpha/beta fold hydrolase [Alkalinema sp. FACHB-956]
MTTMQSWHDRIGFQRDWFWRGWKIRYSYATHAAASDATPILLLHGFGASIGHWRHNVPLLSQHHPVYALDLLGFGASEKAIAAYGTALWVEQVYAFWQEFIRRPIVLVGNSLGSVVCVGLAAKHPDMVAGLALINLPDFSAVEMPAWMQKIVQPLGNWMKGFFTLPPIFVPFFHWVRQPTRIRSWVKGAYPDTNNIDDELVEILSHPPNEVGAARTLAAMVKGQRQLPPEYTARYALPQISIPILLVWGLQDTMVPPSLARKFVEFNPAVKLVEIPQAGHCPHDECPDVFNPILLDWLQSWTAPSSVPASSELPCK